MAPLQKSWSHLIRGNLFHYLKDPAGDPVTPLRGPTPTLATAPARKLIRVLTDQNSYDRFNPNGFKFP